MSTGTYFPMIRVRVQASYLVQDSLTTERGGGVLIGPEGGGNELHREIGSYFPRHTALQSTEFGFALVRQLHLRTLM